MRTSTQILNTFKTDSRGAIAIMFGFMFIILVATTGGAIDYGRWISARSATQSAIDAAVLAGGRALQLPNANEADAIAAAQQYYSQNKSNLLDLDSVSFQIGTNGTEVIATTTGSTVKAPFLGVVGVTDLPINLTATAKLAVGAAAGSHVEVSMMLDITGSMEGDKFADLKLAAKDLVDIVVWADQSTFTSKVAIAPFSKYVNVDTTYFQAVTGQTNSNPNKTCVMERDTAERYSDLAPGPGQHFGAYSESADCSTGSSIMPLSADKTALRGHIDGFSTGGHTAGHLGTGWAWYLLSPNWNSIWPATSQPRPYSMISELNQHGNPKLHKIAILMTDGAYNREYTGPNSTTQARTLCTAMKGTGLTVYTVGFAIDVGSDPDVTMQQCATSPAHYYNAGNGEALRQAFRDIALKIMTLRISN